MQEDGLEEFWWDEFVALTVGVKRERERLQISPVSCPEYTYIPTTKKNISGILLVLSKIRSMKPACCFPMARGPRVSTSLWYKTLDKN